MTDDVQRLYAVARDDEVCALDDLMVRAGLLWECPTDRYMNRTDDPFCGGCGNRREEQ